MSDTLSKLNDKDLICILRSLEMETLMKTISDDSEITYQQLSSYFMGETLHDHRCRQAIEKRIMTHYEQSLAVSITKCDINKWSDDFIIATFNHFHYDSFMSLAISYGDTFSDLINYISIIGYNSVKGREFIIKWLQNKFTINQIAFIENNAFVVKDDNKLRLFPDNLSNIIFKDKFKFVPKFMGSALQE